MYDPTYICGGSSSGSAVSVAANLVSFAISTDTGGSTRVPASLNGLVGLKPTLGTVSTTGLFPACNNIDCVCVMSKTIDDAETVYEAIRAFDETDIFSRRDLPTWDHPWRDPVRFAIPPNEQLAHLSPAYAALFGQFVTGLNSDSASWCVQTEQDKFDYTPFAHATQILYDSSIVAQRLLAFQPNISTHGLDALHPAIRATFQEALDRKFTATLAYEDIFQLAQCKRQSERAFREDMDVLIVPSTPAQFTVAEVQEEPMVRNKAMGRFTNFVNLLDLAAVSVPVGWWTGENGNELSFGVTIIGQAGRDTELTELARRVMGMEKVRV